MKECQYPKYNDHSDGIDVIAFHDNYMPHMQVHIYPEMDNFLVILRMSWFLCQIRINEIECM